MSAPAWGERRLSFGAWAETYDRFRPAYPLEVVEWLVGGAPPLRVLDVGSGTGRLAVAVAALGHDVLAVEPDDGMRAVAERALPGRTVAGTAEALPVPDQAYDRVVAGQAYHWFDRDRALPEIARVLRPDGAVGVVWNIRDDRVPWAAELARLLESLERETGDGGTPDFGPRFGPTESLVVPFAQVLDLDTLVGLVSSFSYVALSPERDDLLAEARRIGEREVARSGHDRLELPYLTRAFRAPVRRSVRGPAEDRPG